MEALPLLATKLIPALAAAVVVAAAALLYLYDPSTAGIYPRCPAKMLTGWDCPGCGSLRALHALLHGRVGDALQLNPALAVAIPAVAFFAPARLYPPSSLAHRVAYSPLTPRVILVAVVAWWIGRNLFL